MNRFEGVDLPQVVHELKGQDSERYDVYRNSRPYSLSSGPNRLLAISSSDQVVNGHFVELSCIQGM